MVDRDLIHKRIETYMAAFTANDREGWLDCFVPDAWIEDPVGTPRRQGREGIGAFWDETHSVAESIELRPLGFVAVAGDEAAFTMQARPNLGGQVFAVDIIDVMSFDDEGKITTMRAFFDPSAMAPVEPADQ